MKPPFTIGAFGAIFDDEGKILLVHRRDRDEWNVPGGVVESGEAPWQAVIREIKEESGIDAEMEYLAGVYVKPEKDDIVFFFSCKKIGGTPTLNPEADRIDYFPTDALPPNLPAKHAERIRDLLAAPNRLTLKTQHKIKP